MKTRLRVLTFLLAASTGLTAVPTQGADGTLARGPTTVSLPDTETWSLRPTRAAAAVIASPRAGSTTLADLPDARRSVRVVYEGYREAGPLRTAR